MTTLADPNACHERAWLVYDTAVEIDGMLLELRHAVHNALGTSGPQIDLRLPGELVRVLGRINTAIGSMRVLAAEMANAEDH